MDTNKYLSKPVTIKQEVEDESEVSILPPFPPPVPPSIGQNHHLNNVAASEMHNVIKPPLFRNENKYNTLQIPSSLPVRSTQQIPATLILSTTKPPLIQVSSILPGGATQPSSLHIPATSLLRVNAAQRPTAQIPATLPPGVIKLPSLAPKRDAHVIPEPSPMVDKVTKPKKRRQKRYVFSKPKRRSKKKQELLTQSLLDSLIESSAELSNKNAGEDAGSDGSSDTILAEELSTDDNTQVPETSTSAEMTKPAELGRFLISGGTVKMLPNKSTWEASSVVPQISSLDSMKTSGSKTGTLTDYENIPLLSAIKKELDESSVVDSAPSVFDCAGGISFNKETEVAQNGSLIPPAFTSPLLNEIGFKKSGKKQTARRGKGKLNISRPITSEENIKNIIETVVGSSNESSNVNAFIDPFVANATENITNLPLAETVLKAKPKRKRAAAKRKSPKKNANSVAPTEIDTLMQGVTGIDTLVQDVTGIDTLVQGVNESEELWPNSALIENESSKKPKRKRAATPRKSPKKNNAKSTTATETGENYNISETIPPSKPKRKRAPAKKKKTNPVGESDATVNQAVPSSLTISVKKELGNSDFQDILSSEKSPLMGSSTVPIPENRAATSKHVGVTGENMIVSLSFEEETSKKDEGEDKLSLLLAFRQRNSKGRFVKSPQTSKKNTNVEESTRVGCTSNLPDTTTLANEIQNSKTTEKALPLTYLSNSEAITSVGSNCLPADAIKIPVNTSIQESGAGFPLNLNIKKEVLEVTENNSTNNKSWVVEQQPEQLPISNQPLTNQSAVQNPENNATDFASKSPVLNTKRKQTARRGRRIVPSGQYVQPSNEFSGEPSVTVSTDTTVSELANNHPPQTIKRKQTARRGRGKGPTRQGRSIEKSNLNEMPADLASHLAPIATSHQQVDLNPVSSSTEPDSQALKLSQKPAYFPNISIKTEPKDPECEVITLDDSPIEETATKKIDNASHLHSRQLNFSGDNCITHDTLIKKEIFTEPDSIPAISSQHSDTSVPLNISQPTQIESSSLRTASPIPISLRSISGAEKLINSSDKVVSAADSNTAACGSSIALFSEDDSTMPTPDGPFIKKEIEDNYTAISFPDGSPSFRNCLNSVISRNEPQLAAANFPVFSTSDDTLTGDLGFLNRDNERTSFSKTLEENWNLPGPSTDAVYSTLSNISRPGGYEKVNEETEKNFQQTSSSRYVSGYQNTLVRRHSPQDDALAFSGVSIESLKNIIGSMEIVSGTGIKDASNSNSVHSNIDKDLPFRHDDEDTSSRTSSFLSRSSPRLSTPLSDSASLRLTDSVSPLTRVPEICQHISSPIPSTSQQAQNINASDSRCSSQSGLNDPTEKGLEPKPSSDVEDESDDLKSKVALKLKLAASLPQYSIKDEGDLVPLENFPVVDGEVECFHKLLLAASFSNLTAKPLDTPPRATASPAIERTDSDLTSETGYFHKPIVELNRTSLLDQFIMKKMAEDNSINRGKIISAHHRVQNINELDERSKQIPSPFNKNELNLKSHIVHPRDTLPNIDLSLERFASRRSELIFNNDVDMETSVSHPGERTFNSDVKSDNLVPCLSEVPPKNSITLKSSESLSNAPELNYSPLPNVVENKKPELDLSILPDMLKLISNLRESSSKSTTIVNKPSEAMPLPEVDSNQLEESDSWKMDNSIAKNIPTMLTSHSYNIPTILTSGSSSLSKRAIDMQKHTSQKNSDEYLDNQKYSVSSNNLINITLPSNELLYNVIKNTQLPSTDDLSSSLPRRDLIPDIKTLNDTSIEKEVLQLPQVSSAINPDLHTEATHSESVSNLRAINNLTNVTASEVYVEPTDNSPIAELSEIPSVKSFVSQPEAFHHSTSIFSNTDTEENVTVEPAISNPIADKIDVAELLKILNTAKSLQTNLTTVEPSHFNNDYNPEQTGFQNTSHRDYISSQDDNMYSYQDNYRDYPNYTSMQLQTPIVHEYGHKSFKDPYDEVTTNLPTTNNTENFPTQSKDPDSSDNEVDNEFVNNESDHQEVSVHEDCADEENSSDKIEESAKEEKKEENIPQYKSRWERIMERKSQTFEKEQISDQLLKDYYSAKVPKSKAKIQKPIAHVQPCSQSSTKKKISENKVCPEEPSLPLKKKVANKTEAVSVSGSPLKKKSKHFKRSTDNLKKKKAKKTEDVSNNLPLTKNKSDNITNKGEGISESGLPLKKKTNKSEDISKRDLKIKIKQTNQAENISAHGLSLKKKSTTEVASPVAKKSKVDNISHKKHSHAKQKNILSEDPSNLFIPDKIVKKKEVKYSGAPKDEDEAAKRLYGRITNRGSFLTESSKKQPPMPKALIEKRNTDKNKSTKLTDVFHSMISTPEIKIAPERDLLQKHSRKLTLESYKMKKGIFNDGSSGIMSPKMDFHSMSSFRQAPTSSTILSSMSSDNSFVSPSDSSGFFSPPDPFDCNYPNPALPPFEGAKATYPRTLLRTPDNPMVMKHSPYAKRPLLPDPVPSFIEEQPSRDFRGGTVTNSQFQSLFLKTPIEIPSSPVIQHPVNPPHPSNRNRHSRPRATTCVCLPPKTLKASVGSSVFKTFDVMLLILEWNVDWLFQQQKNLEPPPISNTVRKVANSYANFEDYYNTYLPLLLLETWQRIYASWTHLHQASPYFCEITSYVVETHTIKVECQAVFRASDAERGLFPEEGNIIMIKFGTKEKGGIKILGYVTNVKVRAFDPSNDPQNTCYRTLKYTASEALQRLSLTFLGAYNSEDFDKNQLIRIQVLCSIKPTLKQNDAMLNVKKSPLSTNIINPLNDGLRIVNVITRHPDPLKVSETISDCVRDIIKGILSPHPLPLLTIAKSLPSSDRLLVLLPLIEKMKHSYKTKVLLCTRTTKALTDIGFHLEGGTVKVVITGSRVDIHQKLKKYHLDDLALEKANSSLSSPLPGFHKSASKEAIESAKMDILQNCDVILSNIRNCHNEFFAKACSDGDCIPQMCCIIDEANLCTEPEISIPLLYGISKLILIGDPDVLAKVCSKTAINYDYNRSLFHRANDLDLASE